MKRLFILLTGMLWAIGLMADDIEPKASGYYDDATTWYSSVPTATDNVQIVDGQPHSQVTAVTLRADQQITNLTLTITGDATYRSLTFLADDPATPDTLTLSGNIYAGWSSVRIDLIIEDGVTLVVNGTTSLSTAHIVVKSGGTLTFNNTVTLTGNNATLEVEEGGTLNINAELTNYGGASYFNVYGTSNVSSISTGSDLYFTIYDGGTVNVTNTASFSNPHLAVNEGGTLNVGGNIGFTGGAAENTINGVVNVTGDFYVNYGIAITGTTGQVTAGTYSGGGTLFGSTVDQLTDGSTVSYSPYGASTTYYSRQSGDWNKTSSWSTLSCGGTAASSTPGTNDKIVICDGHTIKIPNNQNSTTIYSVTINSNGILDANGKNLTINGIFTVDGTFYIGGNNNLEFTGGTGTAIRGTGIISLKHTNGLGKDLNINGSTEISSGTNLYIYGSLVLDAGVTVTNYGTIETTLNVEGNASSSTWINSDNSMLRVSGTLLTTGVLDATATGNTVEYLMSGNVNLAPYAYTYYHLVISGADTKSQVADLTINGNFTVNSGTYNTNGHNLTLKGNWLFYNDSFTEGTGTETVLFTGTADQTLTNPVGETFNNLTINKSDGTLTLNNPVTVLKTLTFTNGIVITLDNNFTLGNTTTEGTLTHSNTARVMGKFKRYIDVSHTATAYLFPVGTPDYYRPLKVWFDNMTATGSLGGVTAEFLEESPGALNPIPTVDTSTSTDVYNTFSDGYWSLASSDGMATTGFDLELVGTNFSSFTPSESTRIFARATSSANWISDGTHDPASGSTARRLNMASFPGEYCFVDPTHCSPPTLSALTGDNDVCIGDTVTYSVTSNETGNTFYWEVYPTEAGTPDATSQSESGYHSSIDVIWSTVGYDAKVKVTARNTCTLGTPKELDVTSQPIAPTQIDGVSAVPEYAQDIGYRVTDLGYNYTYTWTISGGLTDPEPKNGQGTDTITIDWGATGTGNVSVVTSSICGTTAAIDMDVNKYIVIESNTYGVTGKWKDASSWDCNCIPSITDNVRIKSGHTIDVWDNGAQVNNLIIDGGGTLTTTKDRSIEIAGDMEVNGDITYGTNTLNLTGAGAAISGAGTITGNIISDGGNKNIQHTTLLTLNGDLTINAGGISIMNYGHLIVNGDILGVSGISWTNKEYAHLAISGSLLTNGSLEASATANTIEYSGSGQTVKATNNNKYYHIDFTGSGTATLSSDLDINGSVTLSNTASLDALTYNMHVAGDWTHASTGSFQEQTATVTFDGANDQIFTAASGETFYDLVIDKTGGLLTLADNMTASHSLTLTEGDVDVDTYNLILGVSSEAALNYTAGSIYATQGYFKRYLSSSGSKLFPIGTSANYYPATVDISTIGAPGFLSAKFTASDPGAIDTITDGTTQVTNSFTDGYWTLSAEGSLSITDYNLSLTGTGFSSYTIASPTRIIMRLNGGAWVDPIPGVHAYASNPTCYRNAIINFPLAGNTCEFGLGHTNCPILTTPTISGITDVCKGDVEIYSVPDQGNTFTWSVTDGSLTTNYGDSVLVTWGSTASLEAKVQVVETSSCFQTPVATLDVNIHSLPSASILGPVEVPENMDIGPYAISETRTGYQYIWSATGGVVSDDTATRIYVTWGASGTGTLTVKGEYIGCPAAADQTLTVSIVQMNRTTGNGSDWDVSANWTDGVPGNGGLENARILSGHTMNYDVTDRTVKYLVIDDGGVLNNPSNTSLTITAGYMNDGTHSGGGGNLNLNGTSSIILDGVGTTSFTTGTFRINNNVPNYFLCGANLNLSGNIFIADQVTLQNRGTLNIQGDIQGGGESSALQNYSDATLYISGSIMTTGQLIANASNNTIVYNGNADQTIKDPVSSQYYHLSLSGSGTKLLEADADINGNLTLADPVIFNPDQHNLNLAGNWTNASSGNSFIEGTGTVTFDGSTDQTITNDNNETFYNFYVVKSLGGAIYLNSGTSVEVTKMASLQKGIVHVSSPDALIFDDGATVSGTSGDEDAYVDGPVSKMGNDIFIFPIGSGSRWARLGISAPANVGSQFTAQYIQGMPADTTTDSSLDHVSSIEYWDLSRDALTDAVVLTLYCEDSTLSQINDLATLTIGHFNGTKWERVEATASFSGIVGTITTNNPVSSFSPYSLASTSASTNPLPIEILSFVGYDEYRTIVLNWATATETNNDYFEIQHSMDGQNFEGIGKIAGSGSTSSTEKYYFIHENPLAGLNYYRLKQTDYDNKFSYSDIIAVHLSSDNLQTQATIFPNPYSDGDLYLELTNLSAGEPFQIKLFDMNGKLLYQENYFYSEVKNTFLLPNHFSQLSKGVYQVNIITDQLVINSRLIIE